MLSLTVRDDPEQTVAILRAQAQGAAGAIRVEPDLAPWHAFQALLERLGPVEVVVPYAPALAEMVSPRAVRLRRDFALVLSLVKTHALLYRAMRPRDEQGRIVALLEDYRAVHGLVADLVDEGAQASVSDAVRDTVEAVRAIVDKAGQAARISQVAEALALDESAAHRRVQRAIKLGYVINNQEKRGRPASLVPGMALPEAHPVLPSPDHLEQHMCPAPSEGRATVQSHGAPAPETEQEELL